MAFKYIYGTCRDLRIGTMNLGNESLNGKYTTDFFNTSTFGDFYNGNIVKLDLPISENNYTGVIPIIDDNEQVIGTTPKLTRFVRLKYSDIYTNSTDLTKSIQNSGAINNVSIFNTIEEAKIWIRSNCDLLEVSDGKFKLSDETTGIDGQLVEATYLGIV